MEEPVKLDKKSIENILALTPMQEGMLFHYLKDPGSDYYFEQLSLDISGAIDGGLFEQAWNVVVQSNEMLRTVFRWEGVKNPSQLVLKEHRLKPRRLDLSDRESSDKQKTLAEIKTRDREEKFDLRSVPFRLTLCKIENNRYVIIISSHHILYDGWSSGIILREFFAAYETLFKGEKPRKQLKTPFADFVKWLKEQDTSQQENYWRDYLKGFDSKTELALIPASERRSSDKNMAALSYPVVLPAYTKEKMAKAAAEHKVTPASLLYCAWGILLQRYANCGDVVFGTTISGRDPAVKGVEDIVGLFIDTLPFRVEGRGGEKIKDLLLRLNSALQERAKYESTNLVDIKKYSEIDKNSELFDTLVVIENYPLDSRLTQENTTSGLHLDSYSMAEMTHYDLTVNISLFDDIELNFIYHQQLFHLESIVALAGHFTSIINGIIENPGQKPHEIDMLSEKEKNRILVAFNSTAADYPGTKTIHGLFEEQAAKTPDSIALVSHGPGRCTVTYRELNEKSNRSAMVLKEKGAQHDTIVGIMVERSVEMMVGIFAVLKAGSAYLPIDPAYPEERIQYMLTDSGARILLTLSDNSLYPSCPSWLSSTLHPHLSPAPVTSLAYVIYTSGSTGRPKGVMVEHHSVVNRLKWMQKRYPLCETDVILQKTPVTFDVSVWELFWWAWEGAALCLLEPGGEKDPASITKAVETHHITTMHFVPSMLQLMLEHIEKEDSRHRLKSLTRVFASGEALTPLHVETFNKLLNETNGTQLINLYGPTEATVDVSYFDCYGENLLHKHTIPIGKPIDNLRLYIMDYTFQLTPVGVPGELYIGGVGLGRGYLNRPGLTGEKFIPARKINMSSMSSMSYLSYMSKRIYKTGDLSRWLPDGNIEFLGRIDYQVKIRGFRIELGEIENHLSAHDTVKSAVVTTGISKHGDNYLAAYFVPLKEIDTARLRKFLLEKLPGYMVPAFFIPVKEIPLTPSGKVDRKALPRPGDDGSRLKSEAIDVSPGNEAEEIIARAWKELLNRDKVGIDDNFFDLGGNSFTIIRLSSRLKDAFKRDIPVVTLFNYPTIRSLAQYLSGRLKEKEPPEMESQAVGKGMDIAIIGMSGRFPGAGNIEEFWENLKNGVETIAFFSDEELTGAGIDPQLLKHPKYVGAKGMIDGVENFDASFFDFTAAEAMLMDPQLRLFHEYTWAALEDAGYNPDSFDGSMGLYAGITNNFHWLAGKFRPGISASEQFELITLNSDYFSTLISYKLNLKGPSVTVQTACSTSLVAIDMACRALLTGECHLALAGGVGITYPVKSGYIFQEGMVHSSDGHCRAFDAKAEGTVSGSGIGVVVLKTLDAALNDRDPIHAVIKGSASNNDGKRKVGYTAPSIEGQAEVITAARQKAGIAPGTVGYIETHGTGTILGDPIEIAGLRKAFSGAGLEKGSIPIGSVKSNIGHLDAAAGAAGVIKTVLALKHRLIPPSLNYETPNPQIDFENSPFYVNKELKEWQSSGNGEPLRAGVSSFGIGGTNAHVVLEEWCRGEPPCSPFNRDTHQKEYQLIMLSARTESVLDRMTENLVEYLEKNPAANLADVAYTLQVGRKHFENRRMAVVSNTSEAVEVLSSSSSRNVQTFYTEPSRRPVIFMFAGQGSQYVNMGLDLYRSEPLFRQEMDRCFKLLKPLLGYDIKQFLYPDKTKVLRGVAEVSQEYAQTVIFIFGYSLAKLLMSWGIVPQSMIGYSFGEYVTACVSGVFSVKDVLQLIVLRGRLMKKTAEGAMLSIPLPRQEVEPLLKGRQISLAIDNGPSCIVSGADGEIRTLEQEMKTKRIMCMPVNVPHAIHSPLMEPIQQEFEAHLRQITPGRPSIPYISNVSGTWITAEEAVDPGYWGRHLTGTVRFADGVRELLKEKQAIFIEIGPGRDLSTLVGHHTKDREKDNPGAGIINTVRNPQRKESDAAFLLNKTGWLWGWGVPVSWQDLHKGRERYRLPLPTYPFEGRRFWDDSVTPGDLSHWGERKAVDVTGKKADIADWFYLHSWKLQPLSGKNAGESLAKTTILAFTGENPVEQALLDRLRKQGAEIITAARDSSFGRVDDSGFKLNPGEAEDYLALVTELKEQGKIPGLILYLWTFTSLSGEGGFYNLLYLVRALRKRNILQPLRIEVVTSRMHDISGLEEIEPAGAMLQGPCIVVPQECPHIGCRTIDTLMPPSGGRQEETLIGQLLEEIQSPISDTVVAYRGNRRWIKTFEPFPLDAPVEESAGLREKGVYLITGGTGYIGLTLARYLAESVGARLVLTGRGKIDPSGHKAEKIRQLEALGAEAAVISADAADEKQMEEVFRQAEERFGPVNGIIHAAGVVGEKAFRTIDETGGAECSEQFKPKITGTLVLEKLLRSPGRRKELDFCLLVSSLSPIIGGLGFTAYSAANLFMDAFALQQNKAGTVKWVGVNWEGWQPEEESAGGTGAGAASAAVAALAELLITPGEGVEIFKRILSWGGTGVVASTGDLRARVERWIKGVKVKEEEPAAASFVSRPTLSNPYKAPGNQLQETLAGIWQSFFGIDEVGLLDDFFELGGDSLKAITMVAKIQEQLDIEIPLTTFFSHSTVGLLSEYIGEESHPEAAAGAIRYPARTADWDNLHRPFPLTHIQTAYLMGRSEHFEMGGISTHFYAEIDTQLDISRLTRAFNRVIRRHPMLRAIVAEEGYQQFLEEIPYYEIEEEDLTHLDAEQQRERILKERKRMSHYMFDTSVWPLFQLKAFKLDDTTEYLFIGFDLIIGDAASLERIAGELVEFYRSPGKEMPDLQFTFRDYLLAMKALRETDFYRSDRAYWLAKSEDFPPAPSLPLRCSPSQIKRPWFKRHKKVFPEADWERVKNVSRQMGITPSVMLCTAYVQVLAYWSNQADLALNLTVFNRYPFHKDVGIIVGDFTSLVLLELHLKPGDRFRDNARKIQGDLLAALEHRHYDGVEFIREISRQRGMGTQAVMPVVYTSTLFESDEDNFLFWDKLGDIKMSISQTSQVFLDNQVRLQEDELIIAWDFVEDLFDADVIGAMFAQYIDIITALIEGKDTADILRPPEKDRLLFEVYNRTEEPIPPSLLHRMFEQQVDRTPANIALEYGDETLTYGELEEKANRVALYLREQGLARGERVAVITARSMETMVYVMGTLKAGGAYVPIDPDYPEDRRNYIYSNSECKLLIEPQLYEKNGLDQYPVKALENINQPDDLAYVIYTSGSTGRPKGVVITHREAANTIIDINRKFSVNEKDRILGISSMCFDLSVYDVFGTLGTGAALVLIPTQKDVDILIEALDNHKITFWNSVPAILDMVVKNLEENYVNPHLTRALLSGDWIPLALPDTVRKHFPNCDVISLGGATEGSIWSIYYPIGKVEEKWKSIPYGCPLANQTYYVLNYELEMCPVGVAGELYIGGTGVAEGYMNDDEKTKNAFLNHPQLGRIYRTGDYGVFHREGYIEFLGRKDYQVKIRGYRVELGEIETCLLESPGIKSAVVVDRTRANGSKYLCAYIVAREEPPVSQLKALLSEKLPDYMVPAFFIYMERIPLTANGKVDRKSLPQPEEGIEAETVYEPPANTIEEKMVQLWQQVLEVERVGVHDNFFELGGDSLKATTFVSKTLKALRVKIPLSEVFHLQEIRPLAEYIKGKREEEFKGLEFAEERDYYPLSSAQERLFVLQQMDTGSIGYNISEVFVMEGAVDREKLEETFRQLIARYESLRTSFQLVEEEPVQRIHDAVDFEMEYYDLAAEEKKKRRSEGIHHSFIRPFDLLRAPLLRVGLVCTGENRYHLLLDIHHIITDAASNALFIKDFMALYAGEELGLLPFRYKDYSQWQNREKEKKSSTLAQQESYWLEQFGTGIPVLELPIDYPRPAVQDFAGASVTFEIGPEETAAVKEAASKKEVSLYMYFLAVFSLVLAKITGQEDIVVGSPIVGRRNPDLREIMGMFINTLALRNYPLPGITFDGFLQQVSRCTLAAFENQEYQFEELVEKVTAARDVSRNPLFDAMFDWLNMERPEARIAGLKLKPLDFEASISRFDLTLQGGEKGDGFSFILEYAVRLFKPAAIHRFVHYFRRLLAVATAEPHLRLSDMEPVTGEEKGRLLYSFNAADAAYPGSKSIAELFEEQVEKAPGSTAVVFNDEAMTYNCLNENAGRFALLLQEKGTGPDAVTAMLVEPSIPMLVGILGILKAGGAYLPIDPNYPEDRISYMLEDSAAKVLVTTDTLANLSSSHPSTLRPCRPSHPSSLAYIIYTSGTTGKPKGVMIQQNHVVRLLFNDRFLFDFGGGDVWTLFHSYCFDFSVWEMYGALLYGGRLVIIPGMLARDTDNFFKLLVEKNVTVLNQTPSAFYNLIDTVLNRPKENLKVRYVIFGGEALVPSRLREWKAAYPGVKLVNMFGITETTVHVTFKEIGPGELESGRSMIGKPIPTLTAYIFDGCRKLSPTGTPGEFHVGGAGVGRGYLNRPELTAEKFIENPYKPGEKLYRSGDLVRIVSGEEKDYEYEYMGRIDHQVQLRGYRVELGEIESRLSGHEKIKEAVVLAKENEGGDKFIAAYYVIDSSAEADSSRTVEQELREYLSGKLPGYMIPAYFVRLEKIPLTVNGKIDRKALPAPQITAGLETAAPRDEMEERLLEIWAEVLGSSSDAFGINDDFFQLGGHSLKATVLISKIHKAFHVKIPLAVFFETPTVIGVSGYIKGASEEKYAAIAPAPPKPYYAVTPAQKSLYIIQQKNLDGTGYNIPAAAVLEGAVDKLKLEGIFNTLIRRHESLRTSFIMVEGEPVQGIQEENHKLQITNYEQIPGDQLQIANIIGDFIRPFDLSRAPLLRVGLIHPPREGSVSDRHILLVDMHHIISDGTSIGILVEEFMKLYGGEELPPLTLHYKDYSEWLHSGPGRRLLKAQEAYWLKQLDGEIPVLNLPLDYPRPEEQAFEGKTLEFELDKEEIEALNTWASQEDVTLFMLLLALFNVLAAGLSGQQDIIIGAGVAGRRHADLDNIIGMFVNTLALRNYPSEEKTFRQFLEEVGQGTLEALENQDYPFEELVRELAPPVEPGRNPFFDAVFTLQNMELPAIEIPGLTLTPHPFDYGISKFDLSLYGFEKGDGLIFNVEYSTRLFKEQTIEGFIKRFKEIISMVLANRDIKLKDISTEGDLVSLETVKPDIDFAL